MKKHLIIFAAIILLIPVVVAQTPVCEGNVGDIKVEITPENIFQGDAVRLRVSFPHQVTSIQGEWDGNAIIFRHYWALT